MLHANDKIFLKILLLVPRLIINYVKYFLLTTSVLFSVSILIFIIQNLNPDMSFSFMGVFSFIDPAFSAGNFTVNTNEILRIFSLLSLALMIVVYTLGIATGKSLVIKFKYKAIILTSLITLAYLMSFIIVFISNSVPDELFSILGLFYFLNIISATLYLLLSKASMKLSSL